MESAANSSKEHALTAEQTVQYETVLEPPRGWLSFRLDEIWKYRELLYFLIWRDLKVRYRQTFIGVLWAVIQPLLSMVVFSLIFGKLARLPSDGIPYPVFSFAALLPWQLFSRALSDASSSLVTNQHLVTKVYFPRLFLPAASVLSGLADFGISLVILLGMMLYYKIPLTWNLLLLPVFVLFALITALTVGIWLAAVNVGYRDVKYVMPFLVQIWMYATPVVYSSSLVPPQWRTLYGINPMAGVVEGFRWLLLGQQVQVNSLVAMSALIVIVLFVAGLAYFQRMEKTFADVI